MNESPERRSDRFSSFHLLLRWEQEICGGVASFIANTHTVYVVCEHGFVFAFDPDAPEDHQLRWKRHPEGTARRLPRDATIVLGKETISKVASTLGNVPVIVTEGSLDNYTLLELLDGGVLVDTVATGLEAMEELTGETLWKHGLTARGPRKKTVVPLNAYGAKLAPPLIYVLDAHGLYALDAETGWEHRFYTSRQIEWRYIATDEGKMYLTGEEPGTIEAVTLARPGSASEWLYECGAHVKVAPVVDERAVYCLTDDGYLHALDKRTGQPTGFVQLGVSATEPPLVQGDLLYIVTSEGDVRALDARRTAVSSTDEQAPPMRQKDYLWIFATSDDHLISPVLFDDTLFVATTTGTLYGLDSKRGQLLWQNDLGAAGKVGLCCVGDTLVAAASGKVVGFSRRPGLDRKPPHSKVWEPMPPVEAPPAQQAGIAPVLPLAKTPVPTGMGFSLLEPALPRVIWSRALPAPASTEIKAILPHIYVGCEDGTLVAAECERGTMLWQAKVKGRIQSQPQASHQLVCIGTDKQLYAFDTGAGHCLWQRRSSGEIQMNALMVDQFITYVCKGGQIECLDSQTGKICWKRAVGETRPGTLCSDGKYLFIGESQGVHAFCLADGRRAWVSPTVDWITSPLICGEGRVFAGCRDRRLYAIDTRSGDLMWVYKTKDEIHNAPAVSSQGFVYLAGLDRHVYALNSKDGTLRWQFRFEGQPMGSLQMDAATIYFGTEDGFIYAVDTSGQLFWKHDLGGAGLACGPIAAEGNLFATTLDDRLICLTLPT